PFRSEVNTTIIIREALKSKKNIILPRVYNNKLELYFVTDLSIQLKNGVYNIMEPVTELCKPAKISDIDVVVVPGVSFDKKFNRLGYGGGYYDKILSHIPEKIKKIALCFDIQIVDALPVSEHDIKVDTIITETKIYQLL
ncbi:MAG: 5-formyltetrahydrofolate cyclo-ligase, partial [Actinobacteria bacterium RBG_19FT_COMBO_36_27]